MRILLLLFISISLQAQGLYDSIPVHEYKFSYQINVEYSSAAARIHRIAQDLSYIGQEAEAMQIPNGPELEWGFDAISEEDEAYFQTFQAVDAVDYIVNRSANEQVIIINEAHHKPRHRVFTRQLLKGLYDNGYRYFGLETLSNSTIDSSHIMLDTLLQERGYPLNSPITGTYIKEPQMANLIREALAIGFTIFAYERVVPGDRELIQARNIKRKILDKDPDAKILIHCGWYHALESPNRGKKWMAQYLREITGINPFTIYQDILIEEHGRKESPFFRLMQADQPSIFVNDSGATYNGKPDFDKFDALLYQPRTRFIFNRPHWLLAIPDNQIYRLNHERIKIGYPCMVKAFKLDEPAEAVPIDIIELASKWDFTALILPPGNYRLDISNTVKKRQEIRIKVE